MYCVLGMLFPLSTILIFDFGTVSTVVFFSFHFIAFYHILGINMMVFAYV